MLRPISDEVVDGRGKSLLVSGISQPRWFGGYQITLLFIMIVEIEGPFKDAASM